MPEVVSLPWKAIVSWWLYQPFKSGERDRVEPVACGGVLSILSGLVIVVVPPSLVAEHVRDSPVLSDVNVTTSQPAVEVMTDSGSVTLQLSVTLVVYQPFRPSAPVITGTTRGGVGSPGTSGTAGADGVASSAPATRERNAARRSMQWRLLGHDERAAAEQSAIARGGNPPVPGEDVPAVRTGAQSVATPVVAPRPPQSETGLRRPGAEHLPPAHDLEVVVGRAFHRYPVEGCWAFDTCAREGAQQRPGGDDSDGPLGSVRRRVDTRHPVLVLAADRKPLVEEAGRGSAVDDAFALALPAGRA